MIPLLLDPQPPTRSILEAFVTRHQHLVTLERAAEEEQTRLLNSNCSPRLLEQRGLALGGLGVAGISIGLGGKSLVEVFRPLAFHTNPLLPPHTFRNGDPVRIEAHVSAPKKVKKDTETEGIEGMVYKVSKERVVIAVDGSTDVDLPERVRILKLANSVTFDRMEKTLGHLGRIVMPESDSPNLPAGNLGLINTLLGISRPAWKDDVPKTIDGAGVPVQWYGEKLNDSQKEAIGFCLKAEHVVCIHGPPGTGKTHTLIELIFQLLSRPASESTTQPPRILITTPSNLALDNLLLRLHTLAQSLPYSTLLPRGSILRLGHPTRVHRDLVRETLDYKAANGDDGELVRDMGKEIEGHMTELARKRGERGAVKGKDRGVKWQEVKELRKEYRQREAKVVTNVVGAAKVVLATCHSAGSRQLNNLSFDVCIVDEATQAIEAVCWVPILKSRKLILAGDPQQLPPTIMSKCDIFETGTEVKNDPKRPVLKPPQTLETTLFDRLERLYGQGIKRVLQIQYRMNERIASFPSTTLYGNNLISSPTVAQHTLLDLPTISDKGEDARDVLDSTVVFFDTAGCEFFERTESDESSSGLGSKGLGEGSKRNENEAQVVFKWANQLVSFGVPPEEIAVVTPYQAQVALISGLLHETYPKMTIGSVDGLQGQEREAIILSLVRSNPTGEVGFLGEYRRLNVAMTRAKRQLCVVGDSETVGKGSNYLKAWMEWLEINADVRWAGDP